ncbi:Abi family protein [Indiicoccus explosivorum]|uniref:Abi family protein n=1 Tax=Indiicoccus explosivorum TaxID=1917864 RepID=UPI00138FB02E|nr:Abi family protein [Indiicoccus explosivorum]
MDKTFKTLDEQVSILRHRGLRISEESKQVLQKENYYSLVNGYKELFIQTPATSSTEEQYKDGASFEEIKALYDFDFELRMLLLRRILRIENNIKSSIAYTFSEQHGHDNYLKIENFDTEVKKNKVNRLKNIIQLLQGIQGEIAKNITKHNSIKHYMTEYGYVPLWVLVNVLSLGTISKFFNLMKQRDRQMVGKSFQIQETDFGNMIGFLTLIRNKCAHDERLFDFSAKTQIPTNTIHESLKIPINSGGQPIKGNHDIFAAFICLKLFLSTEDFTKTAMELNDTLTLLTDKLTVISIDEVLDKMGFPENWLDIKDL